ncbi:MAG: hypothetical protein ACTHNQ_18625 [Microbacterium sp.]|uniref:hypothetical protein n=1 Tax=Microbacterium sp. TaxID=51671 RepID=UPI003F7EF260
MNVDRRLELADEAALARYLVALRDSGSALTPELAAAFDELTPGQLDVLVGLLVDEGAESSAPGRVPAVPAVAPRAPRRDAAPPADRSSWSGRTWTAVLLAASLATAALVWASSLVLTAPATSASTGSESSAVADPGRTVDLDGLDLSGLDLSGLDLGSDGDW